MSIGRHPTQNGPTTEVLGCTAVQVLGGDENSEAEGSAAQSFCPTLRECPRLWVLRLSFDKLNIRSLNSPNLKAEHVEHFRLPKQLGMQTLNTNTTLWRRHAYQHDELRRTARARRNRCFIFHARRMTISIIVIIFSLSATAERAGDAAMEAAAIVA